MTARYALVIAVRKALEVNTHDSQRLIAAMLDILREDFIRKGRVTVPGMFEIALSPDGSVTTVIADRLLKERDRHAHKKS